MAADTAVMVDMVVAADSRAADRAATVDIGVAADIQAADRVVARPDIGDIAAGPAGWDQMVDTEDTPYKFCFTPGGLL